MVVIKSDWAFLEQLVETELEFAEEGNDEFSDLPKLVLFGDKLVELDESMLSALCNECEKLGYCRKRDLEYL
jgi:hypothetical protein